MSLKDWKSPNRRTHEDRLLLEYWRRVGGIMFAEVLVGKGGFRQWPDDAKPRRIDGVRLVSSALESMTPGIVTFNKQKNAHEFEEIVTAAKIEVVEVKRSLDRVVLGQVIIGVDLLEMEYAPSKVDQVVVCEVGDPVLEAVCRKRGIKVWIPSKYT